MRFRAGEMHKSAFWPKLHLGPRWGAYIAPQAP